MPLPFQATRCAAAVLAKRATSTASYDKKHMMMSALKMRTSHTVSKPESAQSRIIRRSLRASCDTQFIKNRKQITETIYMYVCVSVFSLSKSF